MTFATPRPYEERMRRELKRRADAIVEYCKSPIERLQRDKGRARSLSHSLKDKSIETWGKYLSVSGWLEQYSEWPLLYRLVSFMVKYIMSQPAIRAELLRLVRFQTETSTSTNVKDLDNSISRALMKLAKIAKNQTPTDAKVEKIIGLLKGLRPIGSSPGEAGYRLAYDYRRCEVELGEALRQHHLEDDERVRRFWTEYSTAKSDMQRLLGYEVEYAGGCAAQRLFLIYAALCPSELKERYVEAELAEQSLKNTIQDEPQSIESIRSDVVETHALLDAFLDGPAGRTYLVNRLASFFQLYERERVDARCRKYGRLYVEERVLRPLVAEFLFSSGYYPISEPQLGRGENRPDVLAQTRAAAPEEDAWFLFELKQSGFGRTRASRGTIERSLREAVGQAGRYHELLEQMRGLEPDVYVVVFVKSKADARFEGDTDKESLYWHHVERGRVRFHLRLVNNRPARNAGHVMLIRTRKLDQSDRAR